MRPVVALGTFDGVHLGHQKIIKAAVSYARRNNFPCLVTTFDPHPQQFIIPERGLKLLTTLSERRGLLKNLGADRIFVFKFDEKLRQLSYEEFVFRYLVKKLKAAVVFVGYDFAFGHGRKGGIKDLKKSGKKHGFAVKMVSPFKIAGHVVKSSSIRKFIAEGNFRRGFRFLGHPYRITGKVIKGEGRGRGLGFPTANLQVDPYKLIPAHGVYAGFVNGKKCVANIGSRPTFGADGVAVEVHILNFNRNILGKIIAVDLVARLRGELQFSDVEELKKQIKSDIALVHRMKCK